MYLSRNWSSEMYEKHNVQLFAQFFYRNTWNNMAFAEGEERRRDYPDVGASS